MHSIPNLNHSLILSLQTLIASKVLLKMDKIQVITLKNYLQKKNLKKKNQKKEEPKKEETKKEPSAFEKITGLPDKALDIAKAFNI